MTSCFYVSYLNVTCEDGQFLTRADGAGEPLVAQVWRRQTYTAAVDELDPELAYSILTEAMPSTLSVLVANSGSTLPKSLSAVLSAAWSFSRMLHAAQSNISFGDGDAPSHFRAFVPELGADLSSPERIELVKRCDIVMGGGIEKVGACIMIGLVREVPKEIEEHTSGSRRRKRIELQQIVVRRAQARPHECFPLPHSIDPCYAFRCYANVR
jgi:hypothetical protein